MIMIQSHCKPLHLGYKINTGIKLGWTYCFDRANLGNLALHKVGYSKWSMRKKQ